MPPLFQDFIALKASLFLVVPYVLGLVLAHVAVITLSDAPIAGYNLTFFSRYLLLLLVFCIFAIILGGYLLISYYSYYYHYLFIYLKPFCTMPTM